MNYGDKILAELAALRNELHDLKSRLKTFDEQMAEPVPDKGHVSKCKKRECNGVEVCAKPKTADDYTDLSDLSEKTQTQYLRIIAKLEQHPDVLKRVVIWRNQKVPYDKMVRRLEKLYGYKVGQATLTNYLPVACRFGLVERKEGKYIHKGESRASVQRT